MDRDKELQALELLALVLRSSKLLQYCARNSVRYPQLPTPYETEAMAVGHGCVCEREVPPVWTCRVAARSWSLESLHYLLRERRSFNSLWMKPYTSNRNELQELPIYMVEDTCTS